MNVSAVIVTRGDVDLQPVVDTLPFEWELLVWDNGQGRLRGINLQESKLLAKPIDDCAVYGRYAAIEYASHDLIYVQDDDCIVSNPQAIVDGLILQRVKHNASGFGNLVEIESVEIDPSVVVCNMPQEFRHDFYQEHALVGFGAAFHRDTPARAFERYWRDYYGGPEPGVLDADHETFNRVCDVIFTALSPRVLVDVPKENLEHAYAPNRMYRQIEHLGERTRALEAARQVLARA